MDMEMIIPNILHHVGAAKVPGDSGIDPNINNLTWFHNFIGMIGKYLFDECESHSPPPLSPIVIVKWI